MNVSIKSFDVQMEIKRKGIELCRSLMVPFWRLHCDENELDLVRGKNEAEQRRVGQLGRIY